jgi:hypothetical protein
VYTASDCSHRKPSRNTEGVWSASADGRTLIHDRAPTRIWLTNTGTYCPHDYSYVGDGYTVASCQAGCTGSCDSVFMATGNVGAPPLSLSLCRSSSTHTHTHTLSLFLTHSRAHTAHVRLLTLSVRSNRAFVIWLNCSFYLNGPLVSLTLTHNTRPAASVTPAPLHHLANNVRA